MSEKDIETAFFDLVKRVKACKRCVRMSGSARVLGPGCGALDATVMFIGEAPGRLGADGSHIPFHGDKAGHNFESLIEQVGLSRYRVFVTNAVLCNPRDENGNNATPTAEEIANCSPFLKEQVSILNPKVVVPLGAVALRGCSLVERHSLNLRQDVRTAHRWANRVLIPLYHPGQRAMVHRSYANQLSDYQFVAETTRRISQKRRKPNAGSGGKTSSSIAAAAAEILQLKQKLTYFALHKLLFLAEVRHLEGTGKRLTQGYFVRQKDGPYCVDLHIAKLPNLIPGLIVHRLGRRLILGLPTQGNLLGEQDSKPPLLDEAARTIAETVERYGGMSDADLKRVTYLAAPMRALLRKEKSTKASLFNSAVLPQPE